MTIRAFSYGGGVQSTAGLVLAAQGKIDYPIFLFSNVGEDSEHPETLRYVREIAMPYAEQHNIVLQEFVKRMQRGDRKGEIETVYSRAVADNRTIGIPVFMGSGAPGRRNCTVDFKIKQVNKVLRQLGATNDQPAIIGLGISVDEYQRMSSNDPRTPFVQKEYPLIDLRLTRADCEHIIREAGLPVPPKSSCWFCPFHSIATWRRLQNDHPDLFDRAVQLEKRLNEKGVDLTRDQIYLTRKLQPLDVALSGIQHEMDFGEDACESGYCLT
jgi:hypothetical protein